MTSILASDWYGFPRLALFRLTRREKVVEPPKDRSADDAIHQRIAEESRRAQHPTGSSWLGRRTAGHPISGTAANSYSITASPRSDVDFSQKLMDPMSRKAISSVPKLANRAPFAFVVDPFLVRTADYAVGHRDR